MIRRGSRPGSGAFRKQFGCQSQKLKLFLYFNELRDRVAERQGAKIVLVTVFVPGLFKVERFGNRRVDEPRFQLFILWSAGIPACWVDTASPSLRTIATIAPAGLEACAP